MERDVNTNSVMAATRINGAARMDSVFMDDLRHSREILLSEYERRSLRERVFEWGAEKLWRVL